jgi:hypothetical protein
MPRAIFLRCKGTFGGNAAVDQGISDRQAPPEAAETRSPSGYVSYSSVAPPVSEDRSILEQQNSTE